MYSAEQDDAVAVTDGIYNLLPDCFAALDRRAPNMKQPETEEDGRRESGRQKLQAGELTEAEKERVVNPAFLSPFLLRLGSLTLR